MKNLILDIKSLNIMNGRKRILLIGLVVSLFMFSCAKEEVTPEDSDTEVLLSDVVDFTTSFNHSNGNVTPANGTTHQWDIFTYNEGYSADDIDTVTVTQFNNTIGSSGAISIANDGTITIDNVNYFETIFNDQFISEHMYSTQVEIEAISISGDTATWTQSVILSYNRLYSIAQ